MKNPTTLLIIELILLSFLLASASDLTTSVTIHGELVVVVVVGIVVVLDIRAVVAAVTAAVTMVL